MKGKRPVLMVLMILLLLVLSACANKDARSPEEFTSLLENLDYEVLALTDSFDSATGIVNVLFALSADGGHQIEYYVFESPEVAAERFAGNYALLEGRRGSSYTQSYSNRQASGSYKLTTSDGYYALVRVDDIIVYCAAAKEEKEAVSAAFKALGY